MNDPSNMVPCQLCMWRIQQPDYDPTKENCQRCKNTRLTKDPKDILCNLCGECMCPIGTMNEQEPHGLFNAKVIGGHHSYHLIDTTSYTFSFCEKCLRNLFYQFKIKPTIYDMKISFNGSFSFEEDSKIEWEDESKSYEYRVWIDNGGHHNAYLNGLCNLKKDCNNKALYTVLSRDSDFSEDCSCEEHKGNRDPRYYKLIKFIPNVLRAFL